MIRLRLNPEYRNLLVENHLATFPAIMAIDSGTLFEQNDQRDVRRLELNQQHFFLKRVTTEKISSALESYLGGKMAHSKPFKEMLHFKFLRAKGFDVAEVVAVGEKLRFGVPVEGFIITREVPGRDLSGVYRTAGIDDRLDIMASFGSLVGKLHNQGFFGSTRLKDIICSGEPGESMRMTLIDREVRNPYPRATNKTIIQDRLLLNAQRQTHQGEVFSLREWKVFTRFYCRNLSGPVRVKRKLVNRKIDQILHKAARGQVG